MSILFNYFILLQILFYEINGKDCCCFKKSEDNKKTHSNIRDSEKSKYYYEEKNQVKCNKKNQKKTVIPQSKRMSDEDLSKVKELLKKYGINASDDDINKSYNLSGYDDCITLSISFSYKFREDDLDSRSGSIDFHYNFRNNRLVTSTDKYLIYSKEVIDKFRNTSCYSNHNKIRQDLLKNNEFTIEQIEYNEERL